MRKIWTAAFLCAILLPAAACGSGVSEYEPFTDNGAIIYHEACARCHDSAVDAPLLLRGDIRDLTREKIDDALDRGRTGMDSYPLIDGEYRDALAEFILSRQAVDGS